MLYSLLWPMGDFWVPPSVGQLLILATGCLLANMRSGMLYLVPGLLLARWLAAARPGMNPLLRVLSAVVFVLLNFYVIGIIDRFTLAIWSGYMEWRPAWPTDYFSLAAALLYYVYVACLPEPVRRLCKNPLRALRALLVQLPKLVVGRVVPVQQPAPAAVPEPVLAPVPLHIAPLRAVAIACVLSSLVFTLALNTLAGQNISWLCVVSYMIDEPLFMLCPWLLLGQVVAQLPRRGGGLRVGSSCVFIALGVLFAGMGHVDMWEIVNLYECDVMPGDATRSAVRLRLLLLDALYVMPPLIVGLVSHVRLLRRLQPSPQTNTEQIS